MTEDEELAYSMRRCFDSIASSQVGRDELFDELTDEQFWELCNE